MLDIPLALAAFVLAAEAIGLPQPIGRVLGFGLHSPEWEFDRRLFAAIGRFNRYLRKSQLAAASSRTSGGRTPYVARNALRSYALMNPAS